MLFGFGKPNIEKMGRKKDVRGLIKALEYENFWDVRSSAAVALGNIGDARAVEPLIQALSDSTKFVRRDVAKVLGNIGDARAVEPLIQALTDSDSDISSYAAEALGNIGDARARKALAKYHDTCRHKYLQ